MIRRLATVFLVCALPWLPACIPDPEIPQFGDDDATGDDDTTAGDDDTTAGDDDTSGDDDTTGDDDVFDLDNIGLNRVRTLQGDQDYEAAGWSVAVGDVTGEGTADLAVGAPRREVDGHADAGRIYWLRGQVGGLTQHSQLANAEMIVDGTHADQWLGTAMAVPGDLDDDGYDDLCVICMGDGELWIFAGSHGFGSLAEPTARLTGLEMDDDVGTYMDASDVIAPAGDLDGNGTMEFLVGEPAAGRVWLMPGRFYSGTEVLSAEARASFEGDDWGYAVLGAVNVGAGEDPDIVIGAEPRYDVAIFLDSAWGAGIPDGVFTSPGGLLESPDIGFGRSLASPGDLDGDGFDDFVVGAYSSDSLQRRAFIYNGRTQWSGADWDSHMATFDGPDEAWVGKVVRAGMDLDADGSPELAFGDPHASAAAHRAGAVYVIEADDVSWQSSPALTWQDPDVHPDAGESEEHLMGWSMDSGDLNGDGADELVVGAPSTYAGAPGTVYVYSLGSW